MRRLVPVLILVLTLVAGACRDGSGSNREALVEAPSKTAAAETSRIALDVDIDGGSRSGTFRGEGVYAFRTGNGRLELDLSALGLTGSQGKAEMLLLGELIYVKLPVDLPQLAARPWVKVDLDQLGQQTGIDTGSLNQLRYSDPTSLMRLLRLITGDVEEEGSEQVRGVETTRYRTELDLAKAREQMPPELLRLVDQLGQQKLPIEAWVDEEGRLRRFRQVADLSKANLTGPAAGATGTVVTTFELHDFGVQVDVKPPPAEQVSDLAALLGGAPSG